MWHKFTREEISFLLIRFLCILLIDIYLNFTFISLHHNSAFHLYYQISHYKYFFHRRNNTTHFLLPVKKDEKTQEIRFKKFTPFDTEHPHDFNKVHGFIKKTLGKVWLLPLAQRTFAEIQVMIVILTIT